MKKEQLIVDVKNLILNESSVSWNFIPSSKEGTPVDLGEVLITAGLVAEALYINEERELSEQVLRDTLYYLVGKSGEYYRSSSAHSGAWVNYKRCYGYSPCCCCDWQSSISWYARTLGFDALSRRAVSIQCPASPSGYRREVSEGSNLESHLDRYRRAAIYRCLYSLSKGDVSRFFRR